jgi:Cu-processing system ATP-binding protein
MIKCVGVEKRFGNLYALRDVNISVAKGRVTAIVGPNGSGKSTLIKSILGLVTPSNGYITVEGIRLNGEWEYRRMIGYMPQVAYFPANLSARDVFRMVKVLRGVSDSPETPYVDAFNLSAELDKPSRVLSGGNRQKAGAVIALMFQPEILIFDEPTAGLDPISSRQLKTIISDKRDSGKTVILTSHVMSELDELADDVIFLLDGRVEYAGAIHDLKKMTGEILLESAVAELMKKAVNE